MKKYIIHRWEAILLASPYSSGNLGRAKKPKDRKKVLKRLWKYLYKYKMIVVFAIILTISSNLLALVGPVLSGEAINAIGSVANEVKFDKVFFYCGLMLAFYFVSSILAYILSILMTNLSQKVVFQMREDAFNRLLDLPIGFFDRHQAGEIISHLSYDIDTVNASLSNDLLQIVTSIITIVGSLIMMLIISPLLVLVFLVTIPISVVFTKFLIGKVRPLFRKRSAKLGELNGYVEEIITGQKVIKAYHQEETIIGRFEEKNAEAAEAYYRADYYGSMGGPSINFINNLSLALISVFGAVLFLANRINLGNLSSFVLYSRKFSGPINEMANILSELQSAMAAAERVFKLIDEPTEPEDIVGAETLNDTEGNVSMDRVTFGYEEGKIVIKDLTLDVPSGSLIAIVGHTGAGKTTLVNLLMRFYDPQKGTISIDNKVISGLTRKSLRLAYAMVLQDAWLFNGTVYDNIVYGKSDATIEDVIKVAKAANIHNYVETLPEGYNTVITEDGVNISQGQKQLITIARAMLLDAHMLILDEATSNVDTRTEERIQDAMKTLMEDKTCFVIAHRLSTIQNADIILVVEDGEIIEQGTHKELLDSEGVYNRLYLSQFS